MADTGIAEKIINSPNLNDSIHHGKIHSTEDKKDNNPYAGVDPLELAYLFIFDSVKTGRDSAQIQAKNIQNNALIQNNLIGEEAQLAFMTLRPDQLFTANGGAQKVAQTVLDDLQSHNQEISAVRGVMEDQLNVLRQNAQVSETNLNSNTDASQQSVQQGGSLMQMLTSLSSQISRI